MSVDINQLTPILAELVRKTGCTPTADEFTMLKTVKIRDANIFFETDGIASIHDDKERYQAVLKWLTNREQAKIDAVRAEEDKKRKAEEDRLAAIKKAEDDVAAKKKAEEDAKNAAIRAEQEKKEKAESDAAAQKKAAEEAKAEAARMAKEEDEKMKAVSHGKCIQCGKWIPKDTKEKYLESEGDDGCAEFMHATCYENYNDETMQKCDQCGKNISHEMDHVNLTKGNEKFVLHGECVEEFKKSK